MIATIFVLGIVGGFFSGLLGLGGAVVMIPLMLVVPPIIGVGELSMKAVAGLSMLQVLASSASGMIAHRKHNYLHQKTLFLIGIPLSLCALVGSYFSKYIPTRMITILFGILVVVAFFLLLLNQRKETPDIESDEITYNKGVAIGLGAFTGILSGIVGAGGGFILVPMMIIILKIPLRITIGTSLAIVFLGALLGSIGKIASLQVDILLAAVLIAGSIPAAQVGARVSMLVSKKNLRYCLLTAIFVSSMQVWVKILV